MATTVTYTIPLVIPKKPLRLDDYEREIVRGLAAGLKTKEIACALRVTDHFLTSKISLMLETFGMRSRYELIYQATLQDAF